MFELAVTVPPTDGTSTVIVSIEEESEAQTPLLTTAW
jgi:hypothetical protein